jgi:TPR repeat protein
MAKRTKAYEQMSVSELRAAEPDCRDAEALMTIGLAFADHGEHGEAVRVYDRALEIAPDSACHYNRGNALHELGRGDEAVLAYQAALAIDPTYVKPMINLADELMGLERPADALDIAERALTMDPNSPDARLYATKAATAVGKLDRALAHWAHLAAFGFGTDAEELRLAIEAKRGSADRLAEARAILDVVKTRPGFSDAMKQELYDYAYGLTGIATGSDAEVALVAAQCRLNHAERGGETIELVRAALAADLAAAHTLLGYLLHRGQGVDKDDIASRREHAIAAEGGVADSQFELSVYLDTAIGGPADAAAARTWEQRAAEQGHQRALFNIASFAARGDFATVDMKRAVEYYERAANAGSFAAAERLSVMYAAGAGVERDAMQWERWSRVAAALSSDGPLEAEDRTRVGTSDVANDAQFMLLAGAWKGIEAQMVQAIEEGAQVDVTDDFGMTALMLAAMQGHVGAVKLLLERGAFTETEALFDGRMVRAIDLASDNKRVVELLIDHGAKPAKAAQGKPKRDAKPRKPAAKATKPASKPVKRKGPGKAASKTKRR